jgi:hypothetical protein
MQCAGASEIGVLRVKVWRAVEAQHQISTRKLVSSDEEQRVLEELIDASKPSSRVQRRLHYLLATPFRYPPLRYGSRFGSRLEPGIWYGSLDLHTVFAEVAYYRLLFLEGTRAALGMIQTQLTAFSAGLRTTSAIDLTVAPFSAHRATLTSPDSYVETQALGASMREAGVEAFRYVSARDPLGGTSAGVFSEKAFAETRPRQLETWHCVAQRSGVEVTRRDYFARASFTFDRSVFLVGGVLPAPAL